MQEALERTQNNPSYQAFVNAVQSGVSANLCEALLRIYESGGERDIQVNLRWAYTLPTNEQQEEAFSFDSSYIPTLKEAAAVLRATDPYENYLLQGDVIGLRRDELLGMGRVTIKAKIADKDGQVLVDLEGEDYSEAVTAHERGALVSVRGRLRHTNARWMLENPQQFTILEDRPLPPGR